MVRFQTTFERETDGENNVGFMDGIPTLRSRRKVEVRGLDGAWMMDVDEEQEADEIGGGVGGSRIDWTIQPPSPSPVKSTNEKADMDSGVELEKKKASDVTESSLPSQRKKPKPRASKNTVDISASSSSYASTRRKDAPAPRRTRAPHAPTKLGSSLRKPATRSRAKRPENGSNNAAGGAPPETGALRRSTRVRKAPERYGWTVWEL